VCSLPLLALLSVAQADQPELKGSAPLLGEDGHLLRTGWSRTWSFTYDPRLAAGRVKEWDNLNIWTADHSLAVTVADIGYVGYVSVTWRDLTTGEVRVVRELTPGRAIHLPRSPLVGDVLFAGRKLHVSMIHEAGGRRLLVSAPGLEGGPLSANLALGWGEGRDRIVLSHPWPEGPEYFTLSVKELPLRASGVVRVGGETIPFEPQTAFGVLDWGRSLRPREGTWRWAFGSVGDIGWNLGAGGPADGGVWTQNVVMVEGRAHAFGPVTFSFDPEALETPWRVRTADGRLDLVLTPRHSHSDQLDLRLVATDTRQAFGTWSGTITLEDGTVLTIADAPGLAEQVYNKW